MEIDYQLLTTVASGVAFLVISFASFLAKYKHDKKDDSEEVKKKIEKAVNLDDVVQSMAIQLSNVLHEVNDIKHKNSDLQKDNRKLKKDNEELKVNVDKLGQIVSVKYPLAIKTIKTYRREHPEIVVEIPEVILSDLENF